MKLWIPLVFVLLSLVLAAPSLATECTNSGAAPSAPPSDTDDGTSTACGDSAVASGDTSTALGYNTSSAGVSSIALGSSASSPANNSAALGVSAASSGNNSIALGYGVTSAGESSTALGFFASSAGEHSTALGYTAISDGLRTTALGYGAYANQPDTVIIGSIAGVNFAATYANVGMGTNTPVEAVDVARSAAAARFQLTSFTSDVSQAPQFIQRRARGTTVAPTAVQSNDNLGLFSFRGHNGTSMGGSRATITAQAAGTFSASSTPTRLIFATTPAGKTTPQSVLVITHDGKVQVNGVNLNVPDYVFEDDYALMPLAELRSFIDENGHLPGIPSADEVNAGAHDLAGSDMAQLRKIEELTLYTLQLAERVEFLEAKLAQSAPH